jgi:hypothetical protein
MQRNKTSKSKTSSWEIDVGEVIEGASNVMALF